MGNSFQGQWLAQYVQNDFEKQFKDGWQINVSHMFLWDITDDKEILSIMLLKLKEDKVFREKNMIMTVG